MIVPISATTSAAGRRRHFWAWWRRLTRMRADGTELRRRQENEARLAAMLKEVDAVVAARRTTEGDR